MTDKQIIIDGVDISKCKHYDEVFNYCDQSYLGEGGLLKNTKNPKRCECSPNCYYKQLKRKEQECEELKEKVEELRQGLVNCDKERNLQEANSEFRQRVINRYKQTLAEIKEIAEPYCNACSEFGYGKGKYCKYCNYSKILQKISEVENE